MDSYTLNTVNYNYKTLSHEGFGGVCKYIATPKRVGYSRLLVKHENIQSACNTFMCSRLAELCDVYTPKAYLMSTSNETRRLFPMHPFIVGTEWVEDFSAVDYGSIEDSPALRQQYLGSMALYAMFCRIADTPQFAYSPAKGVFSVGSVVFSSVGCCGAEDGGSDRFSDSSVFCCGSLICGGVAPSLG